MWRVGLASADGISNMDAGLRVAGGGGGGGALMAATRFASGLLFLANWQEPDTTCENEASSVQRVRKAPYCFGHTQNGSPRPEHRILSPQTQIVHAEAQTLKPREPRRPRNEKKPKSMSTEHRLNITTP